MLGVVIAEKKVESFGFMDMVNANIAKQILMNVVEGKIL